MLYVRGGGFRNLPNSVELSARCRILGVNKLSTNLFNSTQKSDFIGFKENRGIDTPVCALGVLYICEICRQVMAVSNLMAKPSSLP